ncbi:agamous-like MADS-box protein AGL82 [Solanum verrucosum]|uniref:agamous-like MADS-box protein AGL82 n=1 Tax=Solanum verrucosum TaxID=315347 RepID=UPI0020D06B29|nr:agamous-like MADS-box protein AGL82 [Solanum verrucosum]
MEKKMKGNMLNYKKKKETIEKKTRELSILCDIKACVILVDPNGEVDTWPENPIDFNPIIQSYKENLNHDQWLNDVFREANESLLVKLNSKLEVVEKRIEFLKMVYGNGVFEGSTYSEKETMTAQLQWL